MPGHLLEVLQYTCLQPEAGLISRTEILEVQDLKLNSISNGQ